MSILNDIAKKVKPGETVYYIDRKNIDDKKTITDMSNEFDKLINNKSNWHKILEAVYKEQSTSFIVAPKNISKGIFTVIDSKKTNNKSFEVQIKINNKTTFEIYNLENKKQTTIFELENLETSNTESNTKKTYLETVIDALKPFDGNPKAIKNKMKELSK